MQGIFGVVRKKCPLYVTDMGIVFKVFMWIHFLNLVCTGVEEKRFSVRLTSELVIS